MKLVYAVDKVSFNDKDHVGVVKKVQSQMKLFNRNGIDTTLCQYEWQGGYPQIEIEKDTDVLYFRRIEPSVKMILKLRQLKKTNRRLRLVMEIPTYPFVAEERERISLKKKLNRWIGEALLKFYVDKIVLIAQQAIKELYGIPTICVGNGVDFSNIQVKRTVQPKREEIHIICVSGCFFWHGYDRIIKGLHEYYKKEAQPEKVFLHVVGEGECLKEYKSLAEEYGLTDKSVYFYGRKVGEELDEIYDSCNIALDCLGAHRKGLYLSSSLKTREYAAKGFPIVTSVKLDIQNEETNEYILMLSANEEPIEVRELICFYHKIYDKKEEAVVVEEIRKSFYPYCDWQFVYKNVVDYLKQ